MQYNINPSRFFLHILSFQTTSASLSPSKIPATTAAPVAVTLAPLPPPPNSDNESEHILRTKQVLERLFPNVPSTDVDYETWLENLSTYIEQQHQQQQQQLQENHVNSSNSNPTANATTANNHQHNGDGNSSTDENITGNGTHHSTGDSQDDDSGKLSQSEELMIQNAKLKSIVAETSEILISLEKKACLQDAYWRSIVQSKDNEIRSMQQNSESST